MPEFDYSQPKTTDNYRKGWDKAFTKEQAKEMTEKSSHYTGETTEKKQP